MSDASKQTSRILFELNEGKLRPALPRDAGRKPRVADGERFLSLAQAADRTGRSVDDLRADWLSHYADFIGDDTPLMEEGVVVAGAADGNAPAAQPDAAAQRVRQTSLDLLHAVRFPYLADEQFDYFVEKCRRHGLNPWSEQVYCELRHSQRTGLPEVIMIVGINGLKLLAHRTGTYAGCTKPVFTYGDNERIPVKAETSVTRLVNGAERTFEAEVFWDECYPPEDPEQLYDRKPRQCLGRCARAAALREAFPEIGELYAPEEMLRTRYEGKRRPGPDADDRQAEPKPALTYVDEPTLGDGPTSFHAFAVELKQLGFDNVGEVVAQFRNRWLALAESYPRRFWAKVLAELRAHPEKYGAAVVEAAGA